MQLTERFSWQGRTIACGRTGTGPPVVFCHGTPWSSATWSAYADALSDGFTVHVWDMPGYGRSSMRPEDPVGFDVQAAAFRALLDHWGLDRPHVVAHDIGGIVTLRALLEEGARYASLMLVDVVAIPPAGSPFYRFVQRHADVLGGLPPYIHEAVVRAYVADASHRGLPGDVVDTLAAPWLTEAGRGAFLRQIAQFEERFLVENERRLGELTLPVRIVWGAEDTWIPVHTGRRLAGLIPGAEWTEVAGAGHLIHYDAPVALADRLRGWLTARTA